MTSDDTRPPRRPRGPDDPPNRRGTIAALVAVLAIGLSLFWAMSAIRSHDAVQDCIDSGRHGCADAGTR